MSSITQKICKVEDCDRKRQALGYCNLHYQRFLRHGDPLTITKNTEHGGKCSIESCNNKYKSNGFCDKHYWRWRENGDPLKTLRVHSYKDMSCCIKDCTDKPKSNNLCSKHYQRKNIYGRADEPFRKNVIHDEKCSVENCEREYKCGGYCATHYARLKKTGKLRVNDPIENRVYHGLSYSSEKRVWGGMMQRCYNKKTHGYDHYGGRDIKVHKRWHNFMNFYDDMAPRPSLKHSLDRIDNNSDYSPENCRWATQKQQMRNTRINRNMTLDGVTKSISEWAEIFNISRGTIAYRLDIGKTPEQALGLY